MCQEIRDKIEKLHKENGMPLKISKAVEKAMINNLKIHNNKLSNNIQSTSNKNIELQSNIINNNNIIEKNPIVLNKNLNSSENMDGNKLIINNNNKNENIMDKNHKISFKGDILAYGTQLTRILFKNIDEKYNELLNSNIFSGITKTTQPAHFIVTAIAAITLYSIWPELLGYGNKQNNKIVTILYLIGVTTHFGTLIWMTFFSGLALYFSLPRHTFGQCQHVLFPMYFALNAILSIITFICFIKIKSGYWNSAALIQVFGLGLCAITEIVVRLYFAPMLTTLMKLKYNFEKMSGSGKEVGYLDQKDLSKCPHYQMVNKRFRKIHMGAAIGNILALACSILHIVYLAQKISIS